MTRDDLEAFGFKEYPVNPQLDRHDANWQYCQKDKNGKRFFVQVRFWRHPEGRDGWDAWAALQTGQTHFRVQMLTCDDMTPAELVDWFQRVWERLACNYYERWE